MPLKLWSAFVYTSSSRCLALGVGKFKCYYVSCDLSKNLKLNHEEVINKKSVLIKHGLEAIIK